MNMRQTFYEFCMLHERTNLLKEWDESRNFPLTPDTVSYGSKKKVWWTTFAARRLHGLEDPHLVALSGGALVAVARRLAHGVGARMPRVRGQDDRHGRK